MDLLTLAIVCLVVALIAGGIGFSGVAGQASTLAKYLAGLFLLAALAIAVMVFAGVRIPL
jgi:uncharacterized membrane protein YtjA (UPF0391 family)